MSARAKLTGAIRRAVQAGRYDTNSPAFGWHFTELDTPRTCGAHSKVYVYVSDDETGYDVIAYRYEDGEESGRTFRKSVRTALQAGSRMADTAPVLFFQ